MIKESYPDFGPTLAAEMLAEHHGFKVSRETVRKWMVEKDIWLSRKQRRQIHQPRLRRECCGELIEIDGADHRWFEDRGDPCTLLVFIDDGNERYTAKFARAPAKPENLHRALNVEPDRLSDVFCLRNKRYVTKELTLKYDRKRIRLAVNDLTRGLVGEYVDVCKMSDGRIQARAKGVALPCSILDPHQQRETHAAITENKHPSAVLAHIKEEQEMAAKPPKVKPMRRTGTRRLAAVLRVALQRRKLTTNEGGSNELPSKAETQLINEEL